MAARSKTAQTVYDAIEPIVTGLGLDLVDVELVTENKARFLRVYVDRPGGVSIDECAKVSEQIDPVIDGELNIRTHDYLEVSSPGLDRPLKDDRDFARYEGSWVEVGLYKARDGQKKFEGWLGPLEDGQVVIQGDDGVVQRFDRKDTAKVKRAVRFDKMEPVNPSMRKETHHL